MANPIPITVIVRPTPSFSIGELQADGTTLSISSTSFFPTDLPRENYALFARVVQAGTTIPILQPVGADPMVADSFPLSLEKDGVYEIRLVAFEMEQVPTFFNKAPGTVVFDNSKGKLVQLVEQGTTRKFVEVRLQDIPLSSIPYYSAAKYYLQTKPGENSRDERLEVLLDYHMQGKKALYKEKIRILDREIRDFDLAIRGAKNEFVAGRYVEAQRILTLLDKLRSDTCLC